ncbi:unnamed protein product [Ophioblennius macclurei]
MHPPILRPIIHPSTPTPVEVTACSLFCWGVKEVRNGVGTGDELYGDNGYDYYTNQGINQ